MEFKKEINHFVHDIWASVLLLSVSQTTKPFEADGHNNTLAGCVQITGEWQGTVAIYCSKNLAQKIASIMWGQDESEIEFQQIQDALGELTNMAGGNIKALLPPPCQLSLPAVAVTDFDLHIPNSQVLSSVNFECEGSVFVVAMLQEDEVEEVCPPFSEGG